jgi:hypothetical protein
MPFCLDMPFNPKTRRVYHCYGKGKAFVYVHGKPYYFTIRPQQCLSRPALKIQDVAISINDAKRLPWKTVSGMARIVVGGNVKPYCIRLNFSTKFDLKDKGMKENQFIFLARSVRRVPNRTVAMEAMSRDTKIAKDDEDKCFICLDNAPDAKFAPCGTVGVCCACAFKLMETTKLCPLCRKEISFFTRASVPTHGGDA